MQYVFAVVLCSSIVHETHRKYVKTQGSFFPLPVRSYKNDSERSVRPKVMLWDSKSTFSRPFWGNPRVCSLLWNELLGVRPEGSRPIHLLWTLLFLKVYATEHVNKLVTSADEKTYRKWTWMFLNLIADLNLVRFSSLIS